MSDCTTCGYHGMVGDNEGHMVSCIEPHRTEGKKILELISVCGSDDCMERIVQFIIDVTGPGPSKRSGA